jgi:cellulose synthase/poly-beta-1,6-N-acetylglucosamine synthase-like glycosyltransferase
LVEEIGFLFAFYLCFMISGSFSFRISSPSTTKEISKTPFFSIIVPSHGTPFNILEKTLEGTLNLNYDKYEIIVSDNGKNERVTENLRKYCDDNHIRFHHKKDDRGFKAGNINAVLAQTKGEYIVILDSDHIPVPDLLQKFLPFLDDPKIGFIQAKVAYRDIQRVYQAANSILYAQFYEIIESGKDHRGMVLFNGTTGCFRKSVLLEIGGFSEETLIEDIDTSILILSKGYQGRFINDIGSYGLVPDSAKAQISQLWRWTHGACNILRIRLRTLLFTSQVRFFKRFELILNAMAFFSGISIILLFSLLSIMIWLHIPILRLTVLDLSMIYLMPTLVSVFTILVASLTILWEDNKYPLVNRLFHLVPFFLFSLGSFLFLISGAIEGLLLRNTPLSESSVWDREFNVIKNTSAALGFIFLLIMIALLADAKDLSLFVIGGVFTWIFVPLMLLWEEFSPSSS